MTSVPDVPATGSGNTKTPSARVKWCFTMFNYTCEYIDNDFVPKLKKLTKFFVMQEELTPETKNRHLQGYLELKKRVRVPSKVLETTDVHYEYAKGSRKQNVAYCTKLESKLDDGKVWHSDNCVIEEPLRILKDAELYEWQNKIVELVKTKPDDRSIHWMWDREGCTGKTALCKYLCVNLNAILVGGSASDAKYALIKWKEKHGNPKIVLYNLARGDTVDYVGLEQIKDGIFFSSKYESEMMIFNSPHVIVFANRPPCMDNLSKDRWVVHNVNG